MKYCALVLAAQRQSANDPLAQLTQGQHKCLLDIQGRPMISWVLETLLNAEAISKVVVSIENSAVLETPLTAFQSPQQRDRLVIEPSAGNLFTSIARVMSSYGAGHYPVIITTADNPLLTPEMLAHFVRSIKDETDVAVAMTRAEVMKAKYPDGQRRFYQFVDASYSNCNLYAILRPQALNSAQAFARGGQFAKSALRMLRAFGLFNFLLYRMKRLTVARCEQRLSRAVAARVQIVEMPFAEAPIDVDNERTLRLAREIIEQRQLTPAR